MLPSPEHGPAALDIEALRGRVHAIDKPLPKGEAGIMAAYRRSERAGTNCARNSQTRSGLEVETAEVISHRRIHYSRHTVTAVATSNIHASAKSTR
jgi:hypothetical protein